MNRSGRLGARGKGDSAACARARVAGIVIGPSGLAMISDIHWSETLAEAGIIFFLCEMGLELSVDRLKNMRQGPG